jgi:hypothetical protein
MASIILVWGTQGAYSRPRRLNPSCRRLQRIRNVPGKIKAAVTQCDFRDEPLMRISLCSVPMELEDQSLKKTRLTAHPQPISAGMLQWKISSTSRFRGAAWALDDR